MLDTGHHHSPCDSRDSQEEEAHPISGTDQLKLSWAELLIPLSSSAGMTAVGGGRGRACSGVGSPAGPFSPCPWQHQADWNGCGRAYPRGLLGIRFLAGPPSVP